MATITANVDFKMFNSKMTKLQRYTVGTETDFNFTSPLAYPQYVLITNGTAARGNARVSGTSIVVENVVSGDKVALLIIGN